MFRDYSHVMGWGPTNENCFEMHVKMVHYYGPDVAGEYWKRWKEYGAGVANRYLARQVPRGNPEYDREDLYGKPEQGKSLKNLVERLEPENLLEPEPNERGIWA